jgi:hypothetical protein
MLDSRFIVEGEVVEAKSPEQAVRRAKCDFGIDTVVTVTEWTGKTTTFVVGKKGRLAKVLEA